MKVIELDEKCKSCKGTGLYVGMAERDGAAVVCHTCSGTGCHHFKYEYEDFEARVPRQGIKRVYNTNPGIIIGAGKGKYRLEDFGGISIEEWEQGKQFVPGTENRSFTCPAWWYQSADYERKPDWKECNSSMGGSFSGCKYFSTKDKCWKRWDKEFNR